eukprot:2133037-Prymnesium_polylepis.1
MSQCPRLLACGVVDRTPGSRRHRARGRPEFCTLRRPECGRDGDHGGLEHGWDGEVLLRQVAGNPEIRAAKGRITISRISMDANRDAPHDGQLVSRMSETDATQDRTEPRRLVTRNSDISLVSVLISHTSVISGSRRQ